MFFALSPIISCAQRLYFGSPPDLIWEQEVVSYNVEVLGMHLNVNQKLDVVALNSSMMKWTRVDALTGATIFSNEIGQYPASSITAFQEDEIIVTERFSDVSSIGCAKFDVNGDIVWSVQIPVQQEEDEEIRAAHVGANGVLTLVGVIHSTFPPAYDENELVVHRIGPDGEVLWNVRYDGMPETHSTDEAFDLAVAQDGSIYVIALAGDDEESDAVLFKFSPAGELIWKRTRDIGYTDQYKHIGIGPDGGVYCTAEIYNWVDGNVSFNIDIVKFDADGNELWNVILPYSGMGRFFPRISTSGEMLLGVGVAYELDFDLYRFSPEGEQLSLDHGGLDALQMHAMSEGGGVVNGTRFYVSTTGPYGRWYGFHPNGPISWEYSYPIYPGESVSKVDGQYLYEAYSNMVESRLMVRKYCIPSSVNCMTQGPNLEIGVGYYHDGAAIMLSDDTLMDIVGVDSDNGLYLFRNSGNGDFDPGMLIDGTNDISNVARIRPSESGPDGLVVWLEPPFGSGLQFQLYVPDGSGQFVPSTPVDIGGSIDGLFVADLDRINGDDIVVYNGTDLWVFLNLGDGTFTSSTFAGQGGQMMCIGDLSDDTIPDLAFIRQDVLYTRLGTGTGSFLAEQEVEDSYVAGPTPGISIADFDLDGTMDILLGFDNPNRILPYSNVNGTFVGGDQINVASGASMGVVPYPFYPDTSVRLFHWSELAMGFVHPDAVCGSDGVHLNTIPMQSLNAVELVDMNGDGSKDVLFNHYASFSVFYNCGSEEPTIVNGVTIVNRVDENLGFDIVPNPTSGSVRLRLGAAHLPGNLDIFDMNGRRMMGLIVRNGDQEFDITDLSQGIYVIRITSVRGTVSRLLVKE